MRHSKFIEPSRSAIGVQNGASDESIAQQGDDRVRDVHRPSGRAGGVLRPARRPRRGLPARGSPQLPCPDVAARGGAGAGDVVLADRLVDAAAAPQGADEVELGGRRRRTDHCLHAERAGELYGRGARRFPPADWIRTTSGRTGLSCLEQPEGQAGRSSRGSVASPASASSGTGAIQCGVGGRPARRRRPRTGRPPAAPSSRGRRGGVRAEGGDPADDVAGQLAGQRSGPGAVAAAEDGVDRVRSDRLHLDQDLAVGRCRRRGRPRPAGPPGRRAGSNALLALSDLTNS